MVAAGQVLLEIDTKQVDTSKNSMDAAKVAWDDAQSTLARMAPLHASGFVSDKEFEGYQTAAEAKRLQYESPRLHMKPDGIQPCNIPYKRTGGAAQCGGS